MKRNAVQKLLSVILCLAMVVSYLPAGLLRTSAAVSGVESRQVDEHTLDQWKQYFGVLADNANNVSLTTEYAGGVWTDKSVFTPNNIPASLTSAKYNGIPFPMTDKGDNFLVALSAIASNKEITGYSTRPTDTVLVLDLSGSMRGSVSSMVTAANGAIGELLALNSHNRVGVVLYSGNSSTGNSDASTATVLMPLDRYTTTTVRDGVPQYITCNDNERVSVPNGVSPRTNLGSAKNTVGGTYTQNGIYKAMDQLVNAADKVIPDGSIQAGTTRLPIMVLMSDGEPTTATKDYTDVRTSNVGNGSGNTETAHDMAFLTQLTMAYAKREIDTAYGTESLLYTLGYSVDNNSYARAVLAPHGYSTNTIDGYWTTFEDTRAGGTFQINDRGNWETVTKHSDAAGKYAKTLEDYRYYTDEYFPATRASDLSAAFQSIVDEIILQAKYYPTYVESDHDHDGYLTFVDKIGAYMEVSDVKGVEVGSRLFSGAALASSFVDGSLGTMEQPSEKGSELIRSIMTRLNINEIEIAKALAVNAYSHGQLSYQDDRNFSHYLGWFSDANGNYVDFWHEDMTDEQIASAVAKGATHIIKSYIFLGDTAVVPGVSDTDMLYMSVRVAQSISTKETIVTWRVPASLVPTVTYNVSVEVNEDNEIISLSGMSLDSDSYAPIRLLYEVELRSDITDWNMAEKVDGNYVAANGGYVFYSNKWNSSPSDTTANTYSHFEPSVQNERYYYTQDTLVMVQTGTDTYAPYTGSVKPSGSSYWHSVQVFEKLQNGALRIHTHYEPISTEALAVAEQRGGQWLIPKDTVHRYYDYEIAEKDPNTTGTMAYSDHPFVVKEGNHYYTYSTQGNNGKLVVTPATGIKLTKNLAEGFTSGAEFTFVVAGDIADAQVVRLDENGAEKSRTALAANGEVKLTGGETVYILGLKAGSYTVSEKVPVGADYHVSSVSVNNQTVTGTTASLTLANQTITPVLFVNDEQGYGSLIVSKDVNYPAGFVPYDDHNNKTFTVDVAFTGDVASVAAPAGAVKDGNTYTVILKDGQSVTFSNIPEGTTYTVTERGLTAGYTNVAIRYSNDGKAIVSGMVDQAHVVNAYAPEAVNVNLKLQGTKTVTGGWPDGATFTLRLWEITDLSSGNATDTGLTATVTKDKAAYQIDMSSIPLDKEGTYYFRLVEDIPDNRIPDMAYDRTEALFYVIVTDTDADGKLEIAEVKEYLNTQLTGNAADGYVVTKDFTNMVTKDIVYLDVQKTVVDDADASVTYNAHLADIGFGLFDSMGSTDPSYYVLTDGAGKAQFAVPVTQASLGNGKVFYLREIAPTVENRVVGMHYDESWRYAVRITWDSQENKAVTEYAPIENGQVGNYVTYVPGQTVFEHTNTYEPNVQSTPAINLSGRKTLNGGNDLGGRVFSFSLYKTTAAFVIQGSALQTVQNSGNAITFAGITFDTPGLHYLSVKEDHSTLGGVTTDENHYHITVLVEKYVDQAGVTRLRVADGYPHIVPYGSTSSVEVSGLNFNNLYTVSGEASTQIVGNKTLTGRPMLNGEFTFKLEEVADENGTALTDGLTLEAENGSATGNTAQFRFAPITYTQEGVHYYKITEKAGPSGNGVTYSNASVLVKVEVKDNGVGGLTATQTMVNANAVAFTNVYTPRDTYTEIPAAKELYGKVLADGQFEFTLTETEADFTTEKDNGYSRTVENDAQGQLHFGQIPYWEEGTHYYVVKEKIPAELAGGITYDETEYRVTVRVVDNRKGQLEAFTTIEMVEVEGNTTNLVPVNAIVFYNKYTISGGAAVELTGEKDLTGKPLTDDMFTFELYETDETYDIDGLTPKTVTNEGGSFSFLLEYAPQDVGTTFYYVVREKNAGQTIDGITYSNALYKVSVLVEDNGNGGIKTTVESAGLTPAVNGAYTVLSGLDFENTYRCADAELTLTVKKTMTGDSSDPSSFEFGLYNDLNADPVLTITSDKDGVVAFERLPVPMEAVAGSPYTFFIREILPVVDGQTVTEKDGITYDDKVYTVVMTVSDGGSGELDVTYTVDGADVDEATYQFAFTNSYKKPPAVTPPTGDDLMLVLWAVLLLCSAAGITALVVSRKKLV